MKLFSVKEDIEKMGFIYEPDKDKCKIFKTNVYYGSVSVWDNGKNVERQTIMTSDDYSPKAYKEALTAAVPFSHVHSFEVPDDIPPQDGQWDTWVCARCHTRKEEADTLKQLLGDDKATKVREMLGGLPLPSTGDTEALKELLESIYMKGFRDGKEGHND